MELDIKLLINKKHEAQRNTFILKWNPSISSYTMNRLDQDMLEWADGNWYPDFDWSGLADEKENGFYWLKDLLAE